MSTKTRQGQRAPGKTQTSISLRKDLLDWARVKADADGRSLSNWIEQLIRGQAGPNEVVVKAGKKG